MLEGCSQGGVAFGVFDDQCGMCGPAPAFHVEGRGNSKSLCGLCWCSSSCLNFYACRRLVAFSYVVLHTQTTRASGSPGFFPSRLGAIRLLHLVVRAFATGPGCGGLLA